MDPAKIKKPDAPLSIEPRKVPSKEEWDRIIKTLSGVFGSVELLVDGYKVTAQRAQTKKNRLETMVYVNGYIKGEWYRHHKLNDTAAESELPEETRRFLRPVTKSLFSPKKVSAFERSCGKRAAKKHGFYEKLILYVPYWSSARSFKNHLLKNNHNIEVLKEWAL
jgi:hypothetical protein